MHESVAVLVAHPDDETLWAGGTLLMHPEWSTFVVSACRASDADRSPKFHRVLEQLRARGTMADLDDGPEQVPLDEQVVEQALLRALPSLDFDRILTHSPLGEYTRHLRHEEVARAVLRLWERGQLHARELWLFAYQDDGGQRLPSARGDADIVSELPHEVWQQKRQLMLESYGFSPKSWEARVTPTREAFFCLRGRQEADAWLKRERA